MLTKGKVNKARPLCDLIKLNTILAQEYVAGKASTGTHVSSDLLNTGRFYMALYPPYWALNLEVTRLSVLYNLKRTPWDYIYGLNKGQVQGHIEDKRGQKEDSPYPASPSVTQPRPASSTATSCLLHSHVLPPPQPPQVPQHLPT